MSSIYELKRKKAIRNTFFTIAGSIIVSGTLILSPYKPRPEIPQSYKEYITLDSTLTQLVSERKSIEDRITNVSNSQNAIYSQQKEEISKLNREIDKVESRYYELDKSQEIVNYKKVLDQYDLKSEYAFLGVLWSVNLPLIGFMIYDKALLKKIK